MKILKIALFLALFVSEFSVSGQDLTLNWGEVKSMNYSDQSVDVPYFHGAGYDLSRDLLPRLHGKISIGHAESATLEVFQATWERVETSSAEYKAVDLALLTDQLQYTQAIVGSAQEHFLSYSILPFKVNADGELFKLTSISILPGVQKSAGKKSFVDHSVLATGKWGKVSMNTSGVHYLTGADLKALGVATDNPASAQIRLYHNGGGMLPERNAAPQIDDLREVPILVADGGDGIFNDDDRLYFYAQGPHLDNLIDGSGRFYHSYNAYSEASYAFVTIGGTGLRISNATLPNYASPTELNACTDFYFHEKDLNNLVGSGRRWFGEYYDYTTEYAIPVPFNDIVPGTPVYYNARMVGRSLYSGTKLVFNADGSDLKSVSFAAVSTGSGADYVSDRIASGDYISNASTLNIKVKYDKTVSSSAIAWLDYVTVEVVRSLNYNGAQRLIRDQNTVNGEYRYALSSSNAVTVWDVTRPLQPQAVPTAVSGNLYKWNVPQDTFRTYAAFANADARHPGLVGAVANQDIHGSGPLDMIIVTHPNFKVQAESLAELHRTNDGLRTLVVDINDVYNEFSGGSQDITAIKNMARLFYNEPSAQADKLQFLLLMGDASYDYKSRITPDHNFIPIYQSPNSFSLYTSLSTDDYFGYLDANDGANMFNEDLDIGIGRLTVKTSDEAEAVVNKIAHYIHDPKSLGAWRNRVIFATDDADLPWETVLTERPERIAKNLATNFPVYNLEKIYQDSYIQQSTSGSQSYPDARNDLFRKVQRGALITNYVGHGGEVGWASERLLQLNDINAWSNLNALSLFITVTCEFSRLDDPARVSAGEQLLLNPDGGAIALLSTTRVVYVEPASQLNDSVFAAIFAMQNNSELTLGNLIKQSKNGLKSSDKLRFSLLGDPAVRLAFPTQHVVLDSINGLDASTSADTLSALELVKLKGHIESPTGSLLANFNGKLIIEVFDKKLNRTTLMNDGSGYKIPFNSQQSVVYRGTVSIENGQWSAEFVVPLDISLNVDLGKISFYAYNDSIDGNGVYNDAYIGGVDLNAQVDQDGPELRLFMNDSTFIDGGLTSESPNGFGILFDENGINVLGTGIGHDMVGVLDGDQANSFVLNDYYEAELNNYKRGTFTYPFYNLADGHHTLEVRVWDVYNNTSTAKVNFVVASADRVSLANIYAYPNPTSGTTYFHFEHNQDGIDLKVNLEVFDQMGRKLVNKDWNLTPEGSLINDLEWNGTDDGGNYLSTGTYYFRLTIRSEAAASESIISERLVYIR